jgi:hypothetical protein
VLESERAAGDCVGDRDVGGAVVGHHALDLDPVACEELECPAQEADRGRGALVLEQLDIGEPAEVVDRDVTELPAGLATPAAAGVGERARVVRPASGDALAGATCDAAELLDVDVDKLARTRTLVADGLLGVEAPALAESDPGPGSPAQS